MKTLKVKDNRLTAKSDFSAIATLTSKFADKTLGQLEREGIFVFPELLKEADDITKDQVVLQSVNEAYQTGNVMGFLGCGSERLVIESRFCAENDDFFLQYLLERVLKIPNIIDSDVDADYSNRLFNYLIFLFPHYLKAAVRKGAFKSYVYRRYNDVNVKGTLDVARHIKVNTPFIGNVAYSRREFSYDNPVTELVRHTVEFIKRKRCSNAVLAMAKDEVKLIVDTTPNYAACDMRKVIEENRKSPIRHAYFREYIALQRLCLLILQHAKHGFGSGLGQSCGILFDGAWLWEEYVAQLIGDRFYHPKNKAGEGAQRLFDGNRGLIYPDFISKNSADRAIADAKYKPADNIASSDYLQLLAYMFRFGAKCGYYLYPEIGSKNAAILRLNRGSTYENNVAPRDDVSVLKLGLKIPSESESYADFALKMKAREAEFLQKLAEGASR